MNLLPDIFFWIFLSQKLPHFLLFSAANQDLAAAPLLRLREQGLVPLEVCESQTLAVLLNHLQLDRRAVSSVSLPNRFITPIESSLNFASVSRDASLSPVVVSSTPLYHYGGWSLAGGRTFDMGWLDRAV